MTPLNISFPPSIYWAHKETNSIYRVLLTATMVNEGPGPQNVAVVYQHIMTPIPTTASKNFSKPPLENWTGRVWAREQNYFLTKFDPLHERPFFITAELLAQLDSALGSNSLLYNVSNLRIEHLVDQFIDKRLKDLENLGDLKEVLYLFSEWLEAREA